MALGGVATGNIKAQLALNAIPAEIPKRGKSNSTANFPINGIIKLTKAKFDINSVAKRATVNKTNNKTMTGKVASGFMTSTRKLTILRSEERRVGKECIS